MIIILTGLPGVGKGTQADKIVEKYNVGHLATGNVFRNLMKQKNELSDELNSYISQGNLVPDELTVRILKEEIKDKKYSNGILFDGFPRTLNQANELNLMLSTMNLSIDKVINLHLKEDIIKDRLSSRLYCPNCQTTFNKLFLLPKVDGICDKCSHELIQRDDDKIEKIEQRLVVAKEQTVPVIEFYKKNLETIDIENKSVTDVFFEIEKVINI